MEELITVTIVLADRNYRLRVDQKDEEVLRKTVKTINDKVIEYKTQFAGKDMQDYISMVLLWFATEQNSKVKQEVEDNNLKDQLNSIEKLLDNQIKA